jgi:2-methylcitrate dehydratase PrpD
VSGTAGRLAAAGAAARALDLPGDQAANALGMAAAQAAGIREVYGSDTKALQPGKAALDGVLVGLLAQRGLTSRDTALEGERGLLGAVSRAPDPAQLVDGLGARWHLLGNGHKLYPSASLTHPAVDAAVAARARLDPARIESVEVRMLPFAASVTRTVHPRPGSDAKFSSAHCVAVALLTGRLGLADFDPEVVSAPGVAELRERIRVVGDPGVGKLGAVLRITLREAGVVEEVVRFNRGTPGNPLSDRELEAKLRQVAAPRLPPEAIVRILNCCWDLDFVADTTELLTPLSVPLPVG